MLWVALKSDLFLWYEDINESLQEDDQYSLACL